MFYITGPWSQFNKENLYLTVTPSSCKVFSNMLWKVQELNQSVEHRKLLYPYPKRLDHSGKLVTDEHFSLVTKDKFYNIRLPLIH